MTMTAEREAETEAAVETAPKTRTRRAPEPEPTATPWKATLPRKQLHEALQIVGRAVSSMSSLPTLKTIRLEAQEGQVRLAATDLELAIEATVAGTADGTGALCVPAKSLAEIISALPEADVVLAAGGEKDLLTITCRRSEYRIHGLSAEDFPPLPEVGSTAEFSLPQSLLRSAIRQVVIATSDDDTRPILTGVLLMVEHGLLRLVATDTHRLAMRTADLTQATGDTSILVPGRALTELLRVLDGDAPLLVRMDANQIQFTAQSVTLVSRLIEGTFPRYERVIPSDHSRRLTIQRDEFVSALRRARIVARDSAARDRVELRTDGESLQVTARGDDGEAHEEFEVVREGEGISIAFNAAYLLEVLGVMDTEGVYLEMTEPLSPAVLRPVGADDYLCVVMPMATQ